MLLFWAQSDHRAPPPPPPHPHDAAVQTATCLRARYALSGTDIAYGRTSNLPPETMLPSECAPLPVCEIKAITPRCWYWLYCDPGVLHLTWPCAALRYAERRYRRRSSTLGRVRCTPNC
eukprot:1197573-Rhodomonas_salina.1